MTGSVPKKESVDVLLDRYAAKKIAKYVWKVWSYVRQHRESMESETTCAEIHKLFRESIQELLVRFQTLLREKESLEKANRDLKRKIKKLTNALAIPVQDPPITENCNEVAP